MKWFFYILFFLSLFSLKSQANDEVFAVADSMPKFPGGNIAIAKHIEKNLNIPAEVLENGKWSGKTYITFVVDEAGKVVDPKVLKSSGLNDFDKEAIRIVSVMPNWIPGMNKGKTVKVRMNIPIACKNAGVISQPIGNSKLSAAQQAAHEDAMAFWNQGHILERDGKYTAALEKYEKCLKTEPENEFALFDKGRMLLVLGQSDKSCEIWKSMSEKNIRKAESEDFTNRFCANPNGKQEAVKYCNEIVGARYYRSAMDELNKGRYEASLPKFDSCLKYQPDYKPALYNKGFMHFKLDQKKAACASWNKLLALDPNDKQTLESVSKNCK